jgi:hypothetical protein
MLPIITKVLLLLGLLILMIANTSSDWVNVGVSGHISKPNPSPSPSPAGSSADILIEQNAGLWQKCDSGSFDILDPSILGFKLPDAAGIIGKCHSITDKTLLSTPWSDTDRDIAHLVQVLSLVCIVAVFLALVMSLSNFKHSNIWTAVLSLVALLCGIAVIILYSVVISKQEIGAKGGGLDQIIKGIKQGDAGPNIKAFRGFGSAFYLQIVGVSLVSLGGLLSLIHHKKSVDKM